MKRFAVALVLTLVLGACGGSSPGPSDAMAPAVGTSASLRATAMATAPTASFDGYDGLHFGIDEASFRKAAHDDLVGTLDPAGNCSTLRPATVKNPRDFGFMFEHGRFVRVDVGTPAQTAPGGGKVGMDETRIRALYGAGVTTQPHKYVAGAHYLRVVAPGSDGVLVFETDATGRVVRWRIGVPPQIDYVEGCG